MWFYFMPDRWVWRLQGDGGTYPDFGMWFAIFVTGCLEVATWGALAGLGFAIRGALT